METVGGEAVGADADELHLTVKEWLLSLRIPEPDADSYANKLQNLGFEDVRAVRDDIREGDILGFMKLGHCRRVLRNVLENREQNGGSPSRHYGDAQTAFASLKLSPTSLFTAPEPSTRAVSYNSRQTPPFVEREAIRMQGAISVSSFPNKTPHADAVARSWVESPSIYVIDSSEDPGDSIATTSSVRSSSVPSSNTSPMGSPLPMNVYPNSDVANWGPLEVMQWLRQFESLAAHQDDFRRLSGRDLLKIQTVEDAQSLGIHFRPHQTLLRTECHRLRSYLHEQQQQQQQHGALDHLSRRCRKSMSKGRLAQTPRMLSNKMYGFVEEEEDESADADNKDEHAAYERGNADNKDKGAKPAASEEIRRKPELRLDLDTIGQAEGPAYEYQLNLRVEADVQRQESDESVGRGGGGDAEARYRRQDIVFLGDLGRGASGCVRKAIHVPSMSLVAVKEVTVDAAEKRQRMVQELRALRSLRTGDESCIVQFLDAFIDVSDGKRTVCIVLEYMNAGTLQDLVDSKVPVNEHMLAAVAESVLKGLKLMHAHKKIHRDIKPSNILLNRSGQIKISDFGVSTELADESVEEAQTFTGTLLYMSPERIMAQAHSTACDIWSLGLCLVTLALGRFPLSIADMSYWTVVQAVQDGPSPALPKESFSEDLCDFVKQCLKKKPEDRPSAEKLLEHPFLERCTLQRPELEPETTEGSEGRLAALASKVMEHRIRKLADSAQHAKAVPPPLKSWDLNHLERLAEQLGMPLKVVEGTFERALQNANRELERYYRYRRRNPQKEKEEATTTPDAASQRRLWAQTPERKDVDADAGVVEVGEADRSLEEISSSSERSDGILSALVLPFRARRKAEAT